VTDRRLEQPSAASVELLRLRLVCEKKKNLGVTSDVSERRREGFSDTNKKINYRTRQETAR
jgi:hypothetical protein